MAGKNVPAVVEEPEKPSVVEAAAGVIPRDGDIISRYIQQDEVNPDERAEITYRAIIEDILTAPDAESVLTLLEAEGLKEYVGRVITIHGFTVNESDFEQGAAVYVAIKAVDKETDTKRIITTGWQRVMAQLFRLKMLNAFPVTVWVHQSARPTKYGSYPLQLVMGEEPRG